MKLSIYKEFPDCAIEVRQNVFVQEQGFRDEFDEIDARATHFVMFDEEKAIGTCRVFWDEGMNAYVLGRLAVRKEYRGRRAGAALVNAAVQYVHDADGKDIALHAQCQAADFYKKLGFAEFGDIGYEQGCPHIWMKKSII